VARVLGNKGQVMLLLPAQRRWRDPGHGHHQGFVVGLQLELSSFNLRQKMLNGRLGSQQLAGEGGVVRLCR
jgi:hypothetical protein